MRGLLSNELLSAFAYIRTPPPLPTLCSMLFSLGVANRRHEFHGGVNCHQAAGRQALRRLWVIGRYTYQEGRANGGGDDDELCCLVSNIDRWCPRGDRQDKTRQDKGC